MGSYFVDTDNLVLKTSGWLSKYAWVPTKLTTGRWIWFKPYYVRWTAFVSKNGFDSIYEYGDLFYVISNPTVEGIFDNYKTL